MITEKTTHVKCINGHNTNLLKEDTIYEVESYNPKYDHIVLKGGRGIGWSVNRFREVATTGTPTWKIKYTKVPDGELYPPMYAAAPMDTTQPAVNNYTCASCHNDRCNTQEKSCWKCGAPIPK